MLFPTGISAQNTGASGPAIVNLRLMQTTDIHAHILSFDYIADRPSPWMGLAGLVRLIHKARSEVAQACLFDTGDFLQGSPLADLFAKMPAQDRAALHPVIGVMNALDYDAVALGNHDFNFGLPFIAQAIEKARFPVICANVALALGDTPCADATFLPPWTILTKRVRDQTGKDHDLRIGVIGVLPPQVDIWDREAIAGALQTRDMVEAAAAYLPHIRAAGADLVVALAHSGIAADHGEARAENAALALAGLPGIDAVLCGHQHRVFPGPGWDGIAGVDAAAGTLHGKPAVMAGFWGSHLGLIDLVCAQSPDGWRVVAHKSHLIRQQDHGDLAAGTGQPCPTEAQISAIMHPAHLRTRAHLQRSIGVIKKPVQSYFALVADDPSVQLVAEAQRRAVAAGLAGRPEASLPLLSAAAPFKVGGVAGPDNFTAIAQGSVRLRDIADLYPYPNRLCAVQVSGAGLRDWLEHAAGQFQRILPDLQDQPLLDPAFPCYNFDVICGLRYVIDLSQPARFGSDGRLRDPAAQRITDLTWNNGPVRLDQQFIVATNSYRADCGSGVEGTQHMRNIPLPCNLHLADVLQIHLSQPGGVDPVTQPVWRFAPLPGASVWFDSAPDAVGYLPDLTGHRIVPTGPAPNGFARFRLYL